MRNEEILNSLSNCINHCNHCADACLDEENVQKMVKCIRIDRACASVCATAADLLVTKYGNIQGLMQYCVQICEECAEECEKHEHQHCKDCAKACRECAEACRKYAA
ncbi:four-helix bundle copper-binding protein [Salinimicrobium oceani]|uniref:Four-helix bundle copper-binding protein n=1 Tax=Salinimicrobium oceani TaxID=2722702 RepID=A0ABX1CY97_9FLAO|nr:four-helix bundle copper-binding protein [Salinimicrobium oceani]NJW53241.1 four-helix bundle copper-binding protein [Salinimicrobium oceani]